MASGSHLLRLASLPSTCQFAKEQSHDQSHLIWLEVIEVSRTKMVSRGIGTSTGSGNQLRESVLVCLLPGLLQFSNHIP